MKVEKDTPAITYETFVEELDEGDSFTTSIIDVLVKVRPAMPVLQNRGLTGGILGTGGT